MLRPPNADFKVGQRVGRGILYALILVYLFVGISIVSDRFEIQTCDPQMTSFPRLKSVFLKILIDHNKTS
jgi:hypothetical protein